MILLASHDREIGLNHHAIPYFQQFIIYLFVYLLILLLYFSPILGDIRKLPMNKCKFLFHMNVKRQLKYQVIAQ